MYMTRRGVDPNILAFTHDYRDSDKYFENFYINDEGELDRKWEPWPVYKDGTRVDLYSSNHGDVADVENGFKISGIDGEFVCPDNWTWSSSKQICEMNPICKEGDVVGTIRGIMAPQSSVLNKRLAVCITTVGMLYAAIHPKNLP